LHDTGEDGRAVEMIQNDFDVPGCGSAWPSDSAAHKSEVPARLRPERMSSSSSWESKAESPYPSTRTRPAGTETRSDASSAITASTVASVPCRKGPNVRHERRAKGREAAFGTSARWRG
jgi:hypothetical protein